MLGHAAYITGWISLAVLAPPLVWGEEARAVFVAIGAVAMWRYGWAALHMVRSVIYRRFVFPRWRRAAEALGPAGLPNHVYLLVTSFRIGTETTRRVYTSVIEEAIRCPVPTTIVASVVEMADQRLIKSLFLSLHPPDHVKLRILRVAGTGKRYALAVGFRAISRDMPDPNDVVAVIDGDSLLSENLITRCVPFFVLHPKAMALTTDEVCEVDGAPIFREWYSLRFAQRHVLMSSVGLSKRVLTLTGRMSMFRASVVIDSDFIRQVEDDWLDHWRLGRFRFLTGDDKSSWFHILRNGGEMLYIPDVDVLTIETPPSPYFFLASRQLMFRWFGNMLRNNGRALALGPKPMGLFTWWCVLDQRLSMWTTLIGPVAGLVGSAAITPFVLLYYLLWIGLSRYFLTLCLLLVRPSVSASYPFLLYYNQVVGSVVKIQAFFRLDKQKWTRQNTTSNRSVDQRTQRFLDYSTVYMVGLAVTCFVYIVSLMIGVLEPPRFGSFGA